MFSGGGSLYRLWLRKGKPFTLQMKGNPAVEHDGGTTVVHLALTDDQAEAVKALVIQYEAECDLIPHERQTAEQQEERQTLLGMQRGDRVWPSAACPTCAWFDPLLEGEPCGRAGWAPEAIAVFEGTAGPLADLRACPVSHVWWGKGG